MRSTPAGYQLIHLGVRTQYLGALRVAPRPTLEFHISTDRIRRL